MTSEVIGEIRVAPGEHASSCACPACDLFSDEGRIYECHFCKARVYKLKGDHSIADVYPYLLPKGWCYCVVYSRPSHEDYLCCNVCKHRVKRNKDGIWEYS